MRKLLGAFVLVVAAVTVASAAEPDLAFTAETDPAVAARIRVTGEAVGGWLVLRTTLGAGVTRAIRVYSQPSNTLLATYVNGDVPAAVNTAWLHEVTTDEERARPRFPLMQVPFRPGVTAEIHTMAAPVADTQLKVLVFGSWPDGDGVVREQERQVQIATNLSKFAFTYTLRMRQPAVRSRGDGSDAIAVLPSKDRRGFRLVATDEVCCGEGTVPCGRECVSCSDGVYCCNYTTTQDCGMCNKNSASCGSCNVCTMG